MSIVELFVIFAVAVLVLRPKDWQLCIDKLAAFTRRIRGYQQTFQQMMFEKLHFDVDNDVDNVEKSTKPDIFPEIDVSNVGNVKKCVGKKSRKKARKVKISTKSTKSTGK